MTRILVSVSTLAFLALAGCDNRTQEGVRWDQIAKSIDEGRNVQPWRAAASPWGNAEHRTGTAW